MHNIIKNAPRASLVPLSIIYKICILVAKLTLLSNFLIANHANGKDLITIYTYESFSSSYGLGPKIKTLFEAECNCEIKYVSLSDANLILAKLVLEGKETKADIILGIDNNLLQKSEDTKLFAPHQIKLPGTVFDIKEELKSNFFVPFDYGWLAFVYSTENSQGLPESLESLINQQKNEKFLVIQDPRTSSPGISFVSWMATLYPDKLKDVLKAVDNHTITYTKGWSEAYNMFLSGRAKMVFSYVSSPLYHILMEDKHHIKTWDPNTPKYLQVEYAGLVKTSPNLELGKKFLKFLLSKPAQALIPKNQWMYPMIDGLEPAEFKEAKPAKTVWPKKISANQLDNLIDTWLNAVSSNTSASNEK